MGPALHVLVNGLSAGPGGGYTVAREITRHLAGARPDWHLSLALTSSNPFHEPMRGESLPCNVDLLWAPPGTARRVARSRYERTGLRQWARERHVDACVQLNGMVIPRLPVPTLAHMQDPWPYRAEAWCGMRDRVLAMLKRREHARTLSQAACVGFTSQYLMDLICGHHGVRPRRAEVFYNGLPDDWLARARQPLSDFASRPMELLTVSNVGRYKRQDLVIRALPRVVKAPGLENLVYRIVGHCSDELRQSLMHLARAVGVERHVVIEGWVPDEQVRALLARARCFVIMSVCESFGIPAIEAMSYGVPVVISDCCALPEVCGDAAAVTPTDQVEPLAERLVQMLTNFETAEAYRRRGAARVQQFAWADSAGRMASAVEAIATPRRSGVPQSHADAN